ncbi:glycosyltransferase family 2 protein [Dictyobacter arantiisoli]|uniref:Glycosyl transferase n=1 Tax=Dictyobacter arantiisoli TaxID=2014874 RepID=A0A5A5T9T0_9CHLR|nr:glycosyltransferase [Dictyobacter arantiisoli]GCF08015.1 glycosyl transferase [Dictyobacter arantiisoli]
MMSNPHVSIIIPFTRPALSENMLQKLQQQTYPSDLIEIILVGAGSGPLATRYGAKALETKYNICYPGEARNIGAHAATGTYLLFLDDDCEPAPDWIAQNVAALTDPDIKAVGGQIVGKSNAFFSRCVDFSRFGFYQNNQARETIICSASMGVPAQIFKEVKGFNETLRSEEDIDFCFRLLEKGYKTLYQPAIKVTHDHRRTTFKALVSYSYFYGRVSGLYVKRLYLNLSSRNKLLTFVQHPILYPIMMFPISLGATLNIIRLNIREYPAILLYAPFIYLSKVASHAGIWQWLLHGFPTQVSQTVHVENSSGETV